MPLKQGTETRSTLRHATTIAYKKDAPKAGDGNSVYIASFGYIFLYKKDAPKAGDGNYFKCNSISHLS